MPIIVDSSDIYQTGPNWIKYSNGIGVAWTTLILSNASTTSWTFPFAYAEVPTVVISAAKSGSGNLNLANIDGAITLTGVNAIVLEWDATTSSFITPQSADLYLYAFGKWVSSGGNF